MRTGEGLIASNTATGSGTTRPLWSNGELAVGGAGDDAMAKVPARHGDGLETIELVAVVLGFGPVKEPLPGHGLAEGEHHGCERSIGDGNGPVSLARQPRLLWMHSINVRILCLTAS